jgi:hypothetical protein
MRVDHHRHRPRRECLSLPEAEAYLEKKGCKVLLQPAQDAIRCFNQSAEHKIALMHVTC